jgi:hypothetical protein
LVKNIKDGRWRYFNDQDVNEIYNVQEFIKKTETPYVLFYKKISTNDSMLNTNIGEIMYENISLNKMLTKELSCLSIKEIGNDLYIIFIHFNKLS